MEEPKPVKMFYFVDESGDPNFLGRKKKNLIANSLASRYFMVGYLELEDHRLLTKAFNDLRAVIADDEYLNSLPSMRSSLKCFHANKDSREVQERVFRILKNSEFRFHAVVLEKSVDQFITRFKGDKAKLYSYMVERLMENRLHLYQNTEIYFAKMDAIINDENMWMALENAKERFIRKWGSKKPVEIKMYLQQPHQMAGLQAVDYCLWAIHRAYHHPAVGQHHRVVQNPGRRDGPSVPEPDRPVSGRLRASQAAARTHLEG